MTEILKVVGDKILDGGGIYRIGTHVISHEPRDDQGKVIWDYLSQPIVL